MLLIHTESKVSLEVLTDTKPNLTWSGRATQYMSEGGRPDGTPNAQSEHSYPYFTLICPFLQNAGRITHGKRNWEKTEVRKSELKRGAKGGAAKSHALFHVTCLQKVPIASLFHQCVFFWYNTEPRSRHLQSSGTVQDRTGKLRELCTVPDTMKTWQDSAFLLLAGRGSVRGEVEERDSWKIYLCFLLNSTIWVFKWV